MAQWMESAVKRGSTLHRSIRWEICRAAVEMFGHGMSMAKVAAPESTASLSVRCGREARSVRSYALRQQPLALSDRLGADVRLAPRMTTARHRIDARSARASPWGQP